MNIASIDIGTNTVLLLIAKTKSSGDRFTTILNEYRIPRIGKGLEPGKKIQHEKIEFLIRILYEFSVLIKDNDCVHTIVTATNALRIAGNSDYIIDTVHTKFGWMVKVIPGEEEARLSFLGASSLLPDKNNKFVIDVGGGSTEIILGNSDHISYKKSYMTGAVELTEKFIQKYPVDVTKIAEIENHLLNIFKELPVKYKNKSIPVIAVAGTPTTLSAILQDLTVYEENKIEGSTLNKNQLDALAKKFSKMTPPDILSEHGKIIYGREDVILAGTIILKILAQELGTDNLIVSGRGIRYGALIDFIKNEL